MNMDMLSRGFDILQRAGGMEQISQLMVIVYGVLCVFGLLNCILGYRILRFWMMIFGFIIGAGAGFGVTYVASFASCIPADRLDDFPLYALVGVSSFRSPVFSCRDEHYGILRWFYVFIYHAAIRIFKPEGILDQFDFLQIRGISPLDEQAMAAGHIL